MDDPSTTNQSWQPPQPASEPQPAEEHYTAYAHQIPDHGSPDPVPNPHVLADVPAPSYAPAEQPAFAPEPVVSTPSYQPPAPAQPSLSSAGDDRPVPVVKVLSVRGVEYAMMSIMLWLWAGALISILITVILGGSSFAELAFPVALMVIAVPIFAFFYVRLRRAELRNPSLRLDASKRRFSQITQILAFLTCFSNLVALAYILMSAAGGNSTSSIGKTIGATLVTLVVAGGILLYYWFDEHKLVR